MFNCTKNGNNEWEYASVTFFFEQTCGGALVSYTAEGHTDRPHPFSISTPLPVFKFKLKPGKYMYLHVWKNSKIDLLLHAKYILTVFTV